ncbi:maleylpyruvate isomerase N-terminal domain-containing protein [Rhodohalobacter mucosus]|uniref:Mycothiol-dependent maleylpyruvate isomerase metal-binding domain-containing protein n=1 Tax=Rhodohalobacter mucosus TaxID=2079485 RepID=A0A316TXE6_9BACT|nr:maleylpyruvate isomerase N-terminal domain-containing protein [Rhodohalobacter mucosus]PWN07284.1 hypothetical protein DDZ15_03180 [Rhodohalobacter mucosus]
MKPLLHIDAIPIFEKTQQELISLLESLSPEEWESPTSSADWRVKDIAAHLLDGDLRRLSIHRDGHRLPEPSAPPDTHESLVEYLDGLNADWIRASKRLSTALIIELTAFTTPKVVAHFRQLDPEGTALFPVGWAGETESQNWFDIAREYTEKWHHQQQIREAVGRPLLTDTLWLSPLIDTLIRGVPAVYNRYAADSGHESMEIVISGSIHKRWMLSVSASGWDLYNPEEEKAETTIEMSDDTAWRLFTKRLHEDEALKRMRIYGNRDLGKLIAKTVSFMK